jgi:hypothetical protein
MQDDNKGASCCWIANKRVYRLCNCKRLSQFVGTRQPFSNCNYWWPLICHE